MGGELSRFPMLFDRVVNCTGSGFDRMGPTLMLRPGAEWMPEKRQFSVSLTCVTYYPDPVRSM